MTHITRGADVITPTLVLGYEARTRAKNIEHDLIGGGSGTSLAADTKRRGTLSLLFATKAAAWAAYALHTTAGVFAITDPDVPEIAMSYVRDGDMEIRLDPDTRVRWLLNVGYREI